MVTPRPACSRRSVRASASADSATERRRAAPASTRRVGAGLGQLIVDLPPHAIDLLADRRRRARAGRRPRRARPPAAGSRAASSGRAPGRRPRPGPAPPTLRADRAARSDRRRAAPPRWDTRRRAAAPTPASSRARRARSWLIGDQPRRTCSRPASRQAGADRRHQRGVLEDVAHHVRRVPVAERDVPRHDGQAEQAERPQRRAGEQPAAQRPRHLHGAAADRGSRGRAPSRWPTRRASCAAARRRPRWCWSRDRRTGRRRARSARPATRRGRGGASGRRRRGTRGWSGGRARRRG